MHKLLRNIDRSIDPIFVATEKLFFFGKESTEKLVTRTLWKHDSNLEKSGGGIGQTECRDKKLWYVFPLKSKPA